MESHVTRQYTLAELEPGWPEELATKRTKSSPRMQGSMRMALRRVSRTPENSRAYAHGDPVNLIDWKAFGRTDELVVREHRDEASARVNIVFDIGSTMRWPSTSDVEFHGGIGRAVAKIELSIRIALYFAHAHLTFGDSVTLGCVDGGDRIIKTWTPSSPAEILRVYETCLRQGFFEGVMSFMGTPLLTSKRFDTGWLISDFLGDGFLNLTQKPSVSTPSERDLSIQMAELLRSKVTRVIHVFSWIELESSWVQGATSYRDDQLGLKIYMGDQLKQESVWKEQIDRWQRDVRAGARSLGGAYLSVNDQMKVSDLFHWVSREAIV